MEGLKVIYRGPSSFINVGQFGEHRKGETKAYPAEFASELVSEAEHTFELADPPQKKQKDEK